MMSGRIRGEGTATPGEPRPLPKSSKHAPMISATAVDPGEPLGERSRSVGEREEQQPGEHENRADDMSSAGMVSLAM